MKRCIRFVPLLLGALILGFLIWKVGIRDTLDHIALMGWSVFPVLCISGIWKCTNTAAWMLAFPPESNRPGFWRIFKVYIAADCVNTVLPAANVGGELAKSYLLMPDMPVSESASSVVANKTVEALSGVIFAATGVGIALLSLPMEGQVRTGFAVAVLVIGSGSALAYLVQRRRPLTRLLDLLIRLGLWRRHLEQRRDSVARMDDNLSAFYGTHRWRFPGCFVLHLVSWALGALEIFLIVRLMGVDVTFTTAFLVSALAFVIKAAFFFVPANLGTFEAGHTYLFFLLGMDPALGLSVALIQRTRRLLWVGLGMVLGYSQLTSLRIRGAGKGNSEAHRTGQG